MSFVRRSKDLARVEAGSRDLKDVLEMRPVYHKTDDRIRAHVFIAAMALFLKRCLEHQRAPTRPHLSGTDALAAMASVGLAELDLNGHRARLVSGGSRDARRIVNALGITDLPPPQPEPQKVRRPTVQTPLWSQTQNRVLY